MDGLMLIEKARELYLEEFSTFVAKQSSGCSEGAPEVIIRMQEGSAFFERLYCVDFINNDGEADIVEMTPERVLAFDPIEGKFGAATLRLEPFAWDDANISHNLEKLPEGAISAWFDEWFDPDDLRQAEGSFGSNRIHCLCVEPGVLMLDLGTAESDAVFSLLSLLEGAGATELKLGGSRA